MSIGVLVDAECYGADYKVKDKSTFMLELTNMVDFIPRVVKTVMNQLNCNHYEEIEINLYKTTYKDGIIYNSDKYVCLKLKVKKHEIYDNVNDPWYEHKYNTINLIKVDGSISNCFMHSYP